MIRWISGRKLQTFDLIEGCDWPWAQMRQQGAVGILGHRNSRILTQDMHMIIMSIVLQLEA